MRSQQTTPPASSLSFWQKIKPYLPKALTGTAGFGISLPNVQYAMAFPNKNSLSYGELATMAPGAVLAAIYNGLSTFIISGAFGSRYLGDALRVIKKEALDAFREGKHRKRFVAVTTVSLLAGITGGSISGNPYTGALKFTAQALGFAFTTSFSFLGTLELLIQLTDKDVALQRRLLHHLKQLDPLYSADCLKLLQGRELNETTLKEFLITFLALAQTLKIQNKSLFAPQTAGEQRLEIAGTFFDYAMSGTFTSIIVPIYFQSGFSGSNIIVNNGLSNLHGAAKITIGGLTGFPSALFSFFTLKEFRPTLAYLYDELKEEPGQILKALVFLALLTGNSAWYFSLARTIASTEDNIFSLSVETDFGSLFRGTAFTVAFIMGMNGLTPLVFPTKLRTANPQLKDALRYLEKNRLSAAVMEGLHKHAFFTQTASSSSTSQPASLPLSANSEVAPLAITSGPNVERFAATQTANSIALIQLSVITTTNPPPSNSLQITVQEEKAEQNVDQKSLGLHG